MARRAPPGVPSAAGPTVVTPHLARAPGPRRLSQPDRRRAEGIRARRVCCPPHRDAALHSPRFLPFAVPQDRFPEKDARTGVPLAGRTPAGPRCAIVGRLTSFCSGIPGAS